MRWHSPTPTGDPQWLIALGHLTPNGGGEMGILIAPLIGVRDVPRHDFAALIARMDRLLAEAATVREQVTAALRRWHQPFWPDRRSMYQRYWPERRRLQMEPTEG